MTCTHITGSPTYSSKLQQQEFDPVKALQSTCNTLVLNRFWHGEDRCPWLHHYVVKTSGVRHKLSDWRWAMAGDTSSPISQGCRTCESIVIGMLIRKQNQERSMTTEVMQSVCSLAFLHLTQVKCARTVYKTREIKKVNVACSRFHVFYGLIW